MFDSNFLTFYFFTIPSKWYKDNYTSDEYFLNVIEIKEIHNNPFKYYEYLAYLLLYVEQG